MPKSKKTKKGRVLPSEMKKQQTTSMLDAIADFCTYSAVIPRFIGWRLVLAPAEDMNQNRATFAPKMVLGHNIESLEIEHHLTKASARAVVVVSNNPDTGGIASGRWPEDWFRNKELGAGDTHKLPPTGPLNLPPGVDSADESNPQVVVLHGVTSPERLTMIAKQYWEELARQDVRGSIVTRDIATIENRSVGIADLLSIRAGDPISIMISRDIEAVSGSYLQRIASQSKGEAISMLVQEGYTYDAAELIVTAIVLADAPTSYRVKSVDFQWSQKAGSRTEIEVMSWIQVIDELIGTVAAKGASTKKGAPKSVDEEWDIINKAADRGEISISDALDKQIDILSKMTEHHSAVTFRDESP
jgi:hypothetical protein